MNKKISHLWVILALFAAWPLQAEVRVPSFFSDRMVLQREKPVPIWGWAEPGEEVAVAFAGQTKSTVADPKGAWTVNLDPMEASTESRELVIKGSNTISIKDVLVGEVWLGAGEQNMSWSVSRFKNGKEEVAAANHPLIRLCFVQGSRHYAPQRDGLYPSRWKVCNPKNVKDFSATAYYFAREIHRELKVPVGIMQSAAYGTKIDPWVPAEAWAKSERFAEFSKNIARANKDYNEKKQDMTPRLQEWLKRAKHAQSIGEFIPDYPTLPEHELSKESSLTTLYNGMIHLLVPYALRGFLWYQGESDRTEGMEYYHKKRALIEGWREKWGDTTLPFYYVQLAPFKNSDKRSMKLPEFWEAQTRALELPHTGMAIINDIGDLKNLQPQNKQDVGKRLALLALAKTYDKDIPVYSGALYDTFEKAGNAIRVHFKHTGGKLASRDGEPLNWFEIAGGDGKYVEAKATIDGDTVVVSSPDVKDPVSVRFAWNEIAEPNLINAGGLPTSAFRTTTN